MGFGVFRCFFSCKRGWLFGLGYFFGCRENRGVVFMGGLYVCSVYCVEEGIGVDSRGDGICFVCDILFYTGCRNLGSRVFRCFGVFRFAWFRRLGGIG